MSRSSSGVCVGLVQSGAGLKAKAEVLLRRNSASILQHQLLLPESPERKRLRTLLLPRHLNSLTIHPSTSFYNISPLTTSPMSISLCFYTHTRTRKRTLSSGGFSEHLTDTISHNKTYKCTWTFYYFLLANIRRTLTFPLRRLPRCQTKRI